MKSFVAILALVAVAAADVSHIVHGESEAITTGEKNDVGPEGFEYGYQTSNGITAESSGALQQIGGEAAVVVRGSSSHTSPEGVPILLSYTADENGYHPVGAHLPTPPAPEPIPEYILRSLEYIKTHPPKDEPIKTYRN